MAISAAEMARRLQKVQPLIEVETDRIIQRSPELLKEKYEEFKRGENPDGSRIGYYRNPFYRDFKRQLNPMAGGTVDLILTGSFTRQLLIERTGDKKYLFDSRDEKTKDLVGKYGLDIMGISPEAWLEYQKTTARGLLVRFIKRNIGQ